MAESFLMVIAVLSSIEMKLISSLFFSFTTLFIFFSIILFLVKQLKAPYYCNCSICESYVNSSWKSEFKNLQDWYSHLLSISPTQTIRIHVLNNVITANPLNVEHMLRTNFDNYPKGKPFSSILGDLLGKGIFNVDGEPWRFQRKMASLELGSVSVHLYAFSITLNEVSTRLCPLLSSMAGSNKVFDLQDVFRRFSFDAICKISFGIDPGCLTLSLPTSEFAAAFDLASSLSAKRALAVNPIVWKVKRLLNIGSEKELRRAISLVDALACEVIKKRRDRGHDDQDDLLSRFMGSVTDDRYLRDIVISFLLAGRDTVASGLTACFFLLSKNPGVVARMRKEIDRVDLKTVSYEQIRSMGFVHATLYESMRLYPPIQFDSKHCLEDDVMPDGTCVTGGTRVTYNPYAMGRMERIWGLDWAEFRPERWLNEKGGFQMENAYRYPVFQGGARTCIGKEMSVMEMKTVIVSVVGEYDLVVVDGGDSLVFAPGLTATVSGGMSVRARRRQGD